MRHYNVDTLFIINNKLKGKSKSNQNDSKKRQDFLERNRKAALKCRQRKKQWMSDLEDQVEFLSNDNEKLELEADALRKEINELKFLLVTHKHCSII
ncbi:uncharacterized protein BX663DRAFT_515761 [Cokeromyces recurvatus]|uniref:uncharacterized protein n=1 Tax=Cokeromyces recurvatus TaxID=90255 RepID=UPI00222068C0|nr:uncharacterized protein BX663DRAFT_515761 [Cokeromyces recurvatus]KAI7900934.1 hypothetical protein BX663DRAFT_515761 [Cokeromyces recurvatus]